ncbi:MAG: hypothetical protein LUE11_08990 [Clostridia bacterium]|nr:hypothetical protein [Clostridia bacterium]
MKCPHCGIYFMEDDKICPVCGKRPGIQAGKTESKTASPKLDMPYQPNPKQSSGKSTARKQTYNNKSKSTEAAWQQAAAGQHLHGNPLQTKKKTGCGTGCLIVVIILVILIATNIISAIHFTTTTNSGGWSEYVDSIFEDNFSEDDAYVAVAPTEAFTGTWRSSDNTMTIMVDEDGNLSWTTEAGSFYDPYPSFYRIDITEDNWEDYCTATDLKKYPLESYTYYSVYAAEYDTADDQDLDMWFYIPKDNETPTSFGYYDLVNYEYGTFIFSSDSTEPLSVPEEQQA